MSDQDEQHGRRGIVKYAMHRLFAENAPYSANEIALVLAIVRHMNVETKRAWPSYQRLQKQTRLGRKTIERTLRKHCEDSPAPLLARRFIAEHRSYTFELVSNPERFAAMRDAGGKRPRRQRPGAEQYLRKPPAARVSSGDALPDYRSETGSQPEPPSPAYDLSRCRCGVLVVTRNAVTLNYIDDLPHVCEFTTTGKTETTRSAKTDWRTNTSEEEPSCGSADPSPVSDLATTDWRGYVRQDDAGVEDRLT